LKLNNSFEKYFDGAMIGFIVAVIIALIGSISTIRYIYTMKKDLQTWYDKDLVGQNSIQIARVNLLNLDRDLKGLLLAKNKSEIHKILERAHKHRTIFLVQMAVARPHFTSKKSISELDTVFQLSGEYMQILDEIMPRYDVGSRAVLMREYRDMARRFETIDRVLDKLDDMKQENDLRVFKKIIRQNEATMVVSSSVLILTILFRIIQFSANRKKKKSIKQRHQN
jgi:hypothetical protein